MPKNQQKLPTVGAVEFVAFPDFQLLDVTGPLQVFQSANAWAEARAAAAGPAYATRVVARATPVRSWAGVELVCSPLTRPDRPLDTLIVAGGRGVRAACEDRRLLEWLTVRAGRARRVVSICSGAFLLGVCGLLDGKRVVTHWAACASLASRFPAARVESDPIFIEDGALWTSGGVAAGIDLSLALIEQDLGRDAAMAVARDLVVYLKRPGGQAQFSAVLELQAAGAQFERLHAWMAGHLREDLSVEVLARKAGMSERSFARHYCRATGLTPAKAVERLRIEAARGLLSTSRLPIKRVAERCGFGSDETMRRSFLRQLAVTPQDYRERFRR